MVLNCFSFFSLEVFLSAFELIISSASSSLKVLLKEFRKSCCFFFFLSRVSVVIFTQVRSRGWVLVGLHCSQKRSLIQTHLVLLAAKGLKMSSLLIIGFIFAIQTAEKKLLLMTVHAKKDVQVLN